MICSGTAPAPQSMLFKAISASVYGIDGHLVQVEVDPETGRMEDFNVVGLPDNALRFAALPINTDL
jgi:hypothetical protein